MTVTTDNYLELAATTEKPPQGSTNVPQDMIPAVFAMLRSVQVVGDATDDLKKALIYGADKNMSAVLCAFPDGDFGPMPPTLKLSAEQYRMLHAAMGMVTEAAEFMQTVRDSILGGKPFDVVNVMEELGDLDWYKAIPANIFGFTMQQVCEANIRKLKTRYPEGFTQQAALKRDLCKEVEALKSVM